MNTCRNDEQVAALASLLQQMVSQLDMKISTIKKAVDMLYEPSYKKQKK